MFQDVIPIAILMAIKASRPLLRKNLFSKMSEEQYLTINTVSILILLIIYFNIKQYLFGQENQLINLPKIYLNLVPYDKLMLCILSFMTIMATLSTFKIEQSNNSSSNIILMKLLGSIATVGFAYYTNKEKITKDMILGYFFIFIGLLMIGNKNVKT